MVRSSFVPLGIYLDIINMIAFWRIINFDSLNDSLKREIGEWGLRKKLRKLEIEGIIKGVTLGQKKKHYYVTQFGQRFTNSPETESLSHWVHRHDSIAGTILRKLNTMPMFYDGRMYLESNDCEVDPDCVIRGVRHKLTYTLAIEVELTRKSSTRFKSKLLRYADSSAYDYILYISNSPFLMKGYRRFLMEMDEHIQSRVILMYDETLNSNIFCPETSTLFFKEEYREFEQVFGKNDRPTKGQLRPIKSGPAEFANNPPHLSPSKVNPHPPTM